MEHDISTILKDKMRLYAEDISQSSIDSETYWIRKSRKVVLAVLYVEKDDTQLFFRGINIEVSIAAGTLCAERNAISNAFTATPDLQKDEIKSIAVAEYDLTSKQLVHIEPCCLCAAWLNKIWGSEWRNNVYRFD
jgi:cytidine deaminase